MQYTTDELVILARVYLAASGVAASRLGREIAGNDKMFVRLLAGEGDIASRSGEQASVWFDKNWPLHVKWPAQVPRARGLFANRDRAGRRPRPSALGDMPRAASG
jgi:hypothetical protein